MSSTYRTYRARGLSLLVLACSRAALHHVTSRLLSRDLSSADHVTSCLLVTCLRRDAARGVPHARRHRLHRHRPQGARIKHS
eukprot:2278644-Rhodomonas_salina.2